MSSTNAAAEVLAELADRVSRLEGWRPLRDEQRVSSGCAELDALLPDGGLRRGTLVEWLAARPASGAATLALLAAREASRAGGAVVVVDRATGFYPPAAIGWGLSLENLIVARPGSVADEQWAIDQVLRSPGVAALLAWPERLGDREFRRWQLAVEGHDAVGLLVRPPRALREPSWADLRLLVEPLATAPAQGKEPCQTTRRLRIEILRARSGATGKTIELALEEQQGILHVAAHPMHLAAPLAPAEVGRRSRGA